MSLMFADSRDHALVALVIKVAHQAIAQSEGFIGRTAVQKIMYFLKALDVPMKYKFRLHHYGPYSDELRDDLDCLLADDVVVDTSERPKEYSVFQPGAESDALINLYKESLIEKDNEISDIVKWLTKFTPEELELIMTLDYFYRVERAKEPRNDIKERVLDRFMDIKGDLKRKTITFNRETLSDWYDKMVELGLFK